MKSFSVFYCIIAFAVGIFFTLLVSSAIYSLGAPRIIIVIALAMIAVILTAFIAFAFGARRADEMSKVAYWRGVERGRNETQSVIQRFLEDN